MPGEKGLLDSLLQRYVDNRRARHAEDMGKELDFQADVLAGRIAQLGVTDLSRFDPKGRDGG